MIAWLVENTIVAALLALGVLGIARLWRPRPAIESALWVVVLVKLLAPPIITWPWAMPTVAEQSAVAGAVEPRAPSDHSRRGRHLEDSRATRNRPDRSISGAMKDSTRRRGNAEESAPEARRRAARRAAESVDTKSDHPAEAAPDRTESPMHGGSPVRSAVAPNRIDTPYVTARRALFAFWACGAVCMTLVQFLRVVRACRMIRQGQRAPNWLQNEVALMASRLGVRPPRAVLVSRLSAPGIWSLKRATLLWPAALEEPSHTDQWRGVVLHELAHLKRRDHWVRWLELVASCIHWWNPVFWFVSSRLRATAELACDAMVTAELDSERRGYAEALIQVAHLSGRSAPAVVLGMSTARREFKRRLTMILHEQVASRVPAGTAVVILALGLLILPGWTMAEPKSESKESAESAASEVEEQSGEESKTGTAATAENKSEQSSEKDASPARERTRINGGLGAAAAGQENQNQSTGAGRGTNRKRGGGGLGADLQGGASPTSRGTRGFGQSAGGGGGAAPTRRQASGRGMGQRFLTGEIPLPSDARVEIFKLWFVDVAELLPFINQRVAAVRYDEKVSTYSRRDYTYPADAVALSFDDRTRTLFARGGPDAIKQVREVLRILDVPVDELPTEFDDLRIYRIKNTSVETVGRVLNDLRVSGATILALVRANAIAIRADEQTHGEILKIVQTLDVAGPSDEAPEEHSSIRGTWEITRAEDSGRESKEVVGTRMEVTDGELVIHFRENIPEAPIQYELDPSGETNHITLRQGERELPGIYAIDGETLQICFNESGDVRPTEFASLPDSPNDVLIVAKRVDGKISAASKKPEPAAAWDQRPLYGRWRVVEITEGDRQASAAEREEMSMQITRERMQFVEGKGREAEIRYSLNPGRSPMEIDLADVTSDKPPKRGIFKHEDGRLTILFNDNVDGPRPTSFAEEPGSQDQIRMVLERAE